MAIAKWNGRVIAESNDTVVVEGNHYFPASSVKAECLVDGNYTTTCGWKGVTAEGGAGPDVTPEDATCKF